MVDVHCHILPGLDDGPDAIEESLAMAESAINDGITHVVATPHCSSEYSFDYSQVQHLRERLQSEIGDRLILATGCDFHLNPENIDALRTDRSRFCINQHDYLLVEFNEISIPPAMDDTLHALQLKGLRPIITHPERNGILRRQPERLATWVRLGCHVQVTAGSLTGTFGPRAQEDSLCWIARGLVHFVATDAHNTTKATASTARLRRGKQAIWGREGARTICRQSLGGLRRARSSPRPGNSRPKSLAATQKVSLFLSCALARRVKRQPRPRVQ